MYETVLSSILLQAIVAFLHFFRSDVAVFSRSLATISFNLGMTWVFLWLTNVTLLDLADHGSCILPTWTVGDCDIVNRTSLSSSNPYIFIILWGYVIVNGDFTLGKAMAAIYYLCTCKDFILMKSIKVYVITWLTSTFALNFSMVFLQDLISVRVSLEAV